MRRFFVCIVVFVLSSSFASGAVSSSLYALTPPAGFSDVYVDYSGGAAAGGQVAGFVGTGSANSYNAAVWSSGGAPFNLNPPSTAYSYSSEATATDGTQQVGYAYGTATLGYDHAFLWSGSPATSIDLTPTNISGITTTIAYGLSATQEVGIGQGTTTGNMRHAFLWSGSASSAVDINPTNIVGITVSSATGTDGLNQVGSGYGSGTGGYAHALLWSGTAASAVDLNPTDLSGINYSTAIAVYGNQQVGAGYTTYINQEHALLWSGTAASAVDLTPTDLGSITLSVAQGTNGIEQVGFASGTATNGNDHAVVWFGTAGSAVDLQEMLPSGGNWTSSDAISVDTLGDIYGLAYGTDNGTTGYFAVEWTGVTEIPEPASLMLLVGAFGLGVLPVRRRRPIM